VIVELLGAQIRDHPFRGGRRGIGGGHHGRRDCAAAVVPMFVSSSTTSTLA
jgi:hypothetical protein